jgi:hypothetical protein
MGYGLGAAGAAALNVEGAGRRTISVMGDGGFWHNGLTSGVGNAVFNKSDNLIVVVDNGYSAATGGQDILSSRAKNEKRTTKMSIEGAVRGTRGELDPHRLAYHPLQTSLAPTRSHWTSRHGVVEETTSSPRRSRNLSSDQSHSRGLRK